MNDEQLKQKLDAFVIACRERGLSVTPQRLALYKALVSTDRHPSPEMLFGEVREQMPTMSLATVYKAVEMFKEIGVVQEVSALHDRMRLDANVAPHHHLVCVGCRQVVDIDRAEVQVSVSIPEESRAGFRIFDESVQFKGLCPECQSGVH